MWWKYPFTRGKTVFVRCILFQHSVMTNPTIFWTVLRSNAYEFVKDVVLFLWYRLSTHMLIFVVNIRPARTFWNSTHCLLSPFTIDWSRNLWHNPMWNTAVNNISYPIYPLSKRTEKGYITKMIPFFFCSVYEHKIVLLLSVLSLLNDTCISNCFAEMVTGWTTNFKSTSLSCL